MNKQDLDQASDSIKQWFSGVNPEAKKAIIRGLAGAALGGAVTGGIAAGTPHDPADHSSVVSPALLGALMGGTAAAGVPAGLGMLRGNLHLNSEPRRPAGARAADMLLSPLVQHPLAATGAGISAFAARDALPVLFTGMVRQKPGTNVWRRFVRALRDDEHWEASQRGVHKNTHIDAEMAKMPEKILEKDIPAFTQRAAHLARETRIGLPRILPRANRGRLALIPAAIAAGALGDKYLKGEY